MAISNSSTLPSSLTPDNATQPPQRNDGGTGRDRDLQLVRRLDWRFLLQDPQLRNVAYFGPLHSILLTALTRFCESLTVVNESSQHVPSINAGSAFDMVVLHSSEFARLQSASSVLRDGGQIYWEIDRNQGLGRRDYRHVRAYSSILRSLGFHNPLAHWHRPNFDSCLEMIPLDDLTAMRYRLDIQSTSPRGLAKTTLVRYLLHSGVLTRIVPCLSLVARKGTESIAFNV